RRWDLDASIVLQGEYQRGDPMADGRDRTLVEKCQRGDRDAYAELVRLHAARVYTVCLGMAGNAADAEDLAQEALVAGFTNILSLKDPDKFGHWIAAIAANLSRNFLRTRANRERLLAARVDRPANEPERFSGLRRALQKLPEQHRLPLLLYYFDDRSTASIAATLGISADAVYMRLSRARGELRKLLEKMEAHNEARNES
ncbi:MAG: sigma-70 family RNA polymerase sigma factor, partial [Candidatus Krumholzibacteria bacterium]|nr:sigma-70 family RNA polymerase sigma factor [Candidatus Krumholzibacteria bacterium]